MSVYSAGFEKARAMMNAGGRLRSQGYTSEQANLLLQTAKEQVGNNLFSGYYGNAGGLSYRVNDSAVKTAQDYLVAQGQGYYNNGSFTFANATDKAHMTGANAGGEYTDIAAGSGNLFSTVTANLSRRKKNLFAGYFGDNATLGG